MKIRVHGTLASAILLIASFTLTAQDQLIAIDTIELNGKQIVLFENNIWQEVADMDPLQRDSLLADTSALFRNCWITNSIIAYSGAGLPQSIPDTTILVLTNEERKFELPYYGKLNSGFGWRNGRTHDGLDIMLDKGDPVKAAFDGKVRYARYHHNGYGNLVIIRHFNGIETYYAHLSSIYVGSGQMVKAGQIIGAGGSTGSSYRGSHLHFEMRWNDRPFDPLAIIDYENEVLFSDTLVLTPASFRATKAAKEARNIQMEAQKNPELIVKKIPDSKPETAAEDNASGVYIIQQGDSLYKIARAYHTTVDEICRENNISPQSILHIGQKIKVN
jgi:murein DD-endopeptidase MepM/ murein hydrolase activator NlpD